MMKLFVKPINEEIKLEDAITKIGFTDPKVYRDFVLNFEDNVILSNDLLLLNISTKALIIKNPLEVELNDKKTLTALYKKLSYRISEKIKSRIITIEKEIFDLIDLLSYESNYSLEYIDSFDLIKTLQMYQVTLQEVRKTNYLEFILTYIKTNFELNNYSIALTFGLTSLITDNELLILKNELAINQIYIVDFYLNNSNTSIDYLIVDSDWNKL